MKTDTSEKILAYIKKNNQVSAKKLVEFLGISPQALFKQLANLQKKEAIYKIGTPPKVFYLLKEKKSEIKVFHVDSKIQKIIEENYLLITPSGEQKNGFEGFVHWCEKQNLPVEKTALHYVETLQKYAVYKQNELIDGMQKLKTTFKEVFLDEVFYLDFYSIERFGKTKLGQLLLYAKQSQNKRFIKEVIQTLQPAIVQLVNNKHIQAIGFVSPTIKREVQFMSELKKNLHTDLPEICITKIKTDIIVPQKTLNKLADRVENAQNTFVVEEPKKYDVILLIDDAVGSGATLNEIAKKIKAQNIAQKVIGLALTGSFSGFDVISEV